MALVRSSAKESQLPRLSEHDVLVKFHAWSLNYPEIARSDAAGEVVAVVSGVKDFKTGDGVFPVYYPSYEFGPAPTSNGHGVPDLDAPGTFREYAIFDQRALMPTPKNLSYEETASLPCSALTAWNALYVRTPIKPGSWVQ
ncbi:zinc-containing alcohol dehydrogenase [Colletotrichum tofieldiae]|nr:zinc-containing alcohol dehydrogenase [Colletotrichum tofieldiae]